MPFMGLMPFMRETTPRLVAEENAWPASARCNGASGSVCAPELPPADDRNALATTAGGIVLAVCICTLKPILTATPARSISLPRPATVNGASLSEKRGATWPRASVSRRPQIHPRAVGKLHPVTICCELSDADQIIKSKHGGTDRRLCTRPWPCVTTIAARWRGQLPAGLLWPASARCNLIAGFGAKVLKATWRELGGPHRSIGYFDDQGKLAAWACRCTCLPRQSRPHGAAFAAMPTCSTSLASPATVDSETKNEGRLGLAL